MDDTREAASVKNHYSRPDLWPAILEALRAAGKDPEALTPADLAPVDQFHIRGTEATLELGRLATIAPDAAVLDVGGGLGGPARTLAQAFGCRVTVLDLTEEYCRVGAELARRTGQEGQVEFRVGSALAMPFDPARFDVVWTQHSSMNIEDKERLYVECRRVLKPGGRLAIYEVAGGSRSPIHFPVPWARTEAASFLRPAEALRALVAAAGFRELAWADLSEAARLWFGERLAQGPARPGALGLHLLLGADAGPMFRNMLRNLEEDRIRVVQGVWSRT